QHAPAIVRAQCSDHVAFAVELDTVRHARGAAEDRGLPAVRIELPNVARLRVLLRLVATKLREGDVAEIDHAVVPHRHAFGQHAAAVEDAVQLGTRWNEARVTGGRRKAGIVGVRGTACEYERDADGGALHGLQDSHHLLLSRKNIHSSSLDATNAGPPARQAVPLP